MGKWQQNTFQSQQFSVRGLYLMCLYYMQLQFQQSTSQTAFMRYMTPIFTSTEGATKTNTIQSINNSTNQSSEIT